MGQDIRVVSMDSRSVIKKGEGVPTSSSFSNSNIEKVVQNGKRVE